MPDTLTHQLSRFICREADELAPPVTHEALRAILDTLAVTLAGGKDEAVRCLEGSLDAGVGACPSPWSGQRYGSFDAALLYGMASHMDDYDDVSMLAICHPSAPVFSALAAAELSGTEGPTSGRDFVTAFSVGTEVTIRLGQAMGFRHYELGFHATSTLGVVGVAAALARRARLDEATTRQALAIAASMASGISKNFGSTVKPLHVGMAATAGLRAVRMARAGVTAASEAFEHGGYLRAYSGGETDTFPASGLAFGRPFVLGEPGFEQKRYPCCYMLHKTIEATLALRREGRLTLADVANARLSVAPGVTKPLIHPRPSIGLHGKFSAPYAVMAGLADGAINNASFTAEAVLRPQVQARLGDLEVVEEGPEPPPGTDLGRMPVTLCLTLRDGRKLVHTVVASPGSPDDPLTLPQLRQKWVDCLVHAKPALDPQTAHAWFDQGLALDQADEVRPWLARVFAPAA